MPRAAGVVFGGGGTGGHVWPGLAVAAQLRSAGVAPLRWIGDPARLEARLVPAAGIELLPWGLGRPRIADPRWWIRSLVHGWRTFRHLLRRPPRAVVATGGYASLLPGLLAFCLRRPLVVLESNALPGRTNRLLACFAAVTVVQFPIAASRLAPPVLLLGNPVRPLRRMPRGRGRELTVLVMGGSQSARSLNRLLRDAAPGLARIPELRIVHLAGEEEADEVRATYRRHDLAAVVQSFCDDMPALYERVDLALCRSGATTVAELCSAGIGACYVPLPWAADDHQTANARAVAAVGGAVVLPQRDLHAEGLTHLLARLAARRDEVARLGEGAARLARPQAARSVAREVRRLAEPRR